MAKRSEKPSTCFHFRNDETVPEGIRRIVREQIAAAGAELSGAATSPHEAIHRARKHFKKIRGVLRLARPLLGPVYREENCWFRDAGRKLSKVRDAEAMIETLDRLQKRFAKTIKQTSAQTLRKALIAERERIAGEETDVEEKTAALAKKLEEATGRSATWPLNAEGFEGIAPGLKKIYAQARRRFASAYAHSSPEEFHEFRKSVKYHWYHARLLKEIWPDLLKTYAGSLHDLSGMLGEIHDLDVLRAKLKEQPKSFGGLRRLKPWFGLMDARQAELRTGARTLSTRLFFEKPKQFVARFEAYWQAWREEKK